MNKCFIIKTAHGEVKIQGDVAALVDLNYRDIEKLDGFIASMVESAKKWVGCRPERSDDGTWYIKGYLDTPLFATHKAAQNWLDEQRISVTEVPF